MGYSSQQEPVRPWRVISSTPLAGGMLHVVSWEGPRNIRVWLPPGAHTCRWRGLSVASSYTNRRKILHQLVVASKDPQLAADHCSIC